MKNLAVLRMVGPVSHCNFIVSSEGNLSPLMFTGKLLFHIYAEIQVCLPDLG
jgi:hypothetical protein